MRKLAYPNRGRFHVKQARRRMKMKREDLKALELTDEQIDEVMKFYGQSKKVDEDKVHIIV